MEYFRTITSLAVEPVRARLRREVAALRARWGPGSLRIFCYHGVVERVTDPHLERNLTPLDIFRQQMRFLSRFRVLSLPELQAEIARPSWEQPMVVITVDDGYRNNLLMAEVLAELDLPWMLFVSTGELQETPADPPRTIWTVELSLLMLHGQASEVDVLGKRWPLTSRAARLRAFQTVRGPLKTLPAPDRQAILGLIRAQFPRGETGRLLEQFPSLAMMSWEEVAMLARNGVTIGSHGVMHEIHHASQPPAVRARELRESRLTLEARLGQPCPIFAFPNGTFTVGSGVEAAEAGYEMAFTTQPGVVPPGADQFLLPRFDPGRSIEKRFLTGAE